MGEQAGERFAAAHALAQLAEEIRGCTRCPLPAHSAVTVPGEGRTLSDVMLVGGRMRRTTAGQHVFAMYHPAAALHQVSLRDTLFNGIRDVPGALPAARDADGVRGQGWVEDDRSDDAEQMTLF